jgi:enamine deaminase RidA (YjgF/YER057c/UK114 family)
MHSFGSIGIDGVNGQAFEKGKTAMTQSKVNPWKWQDQYGFSQAIEISGSRRFLFCAGQTALDAEGKVTFAGDMRGQIKAAMNNLETVLAAAGLSLTHIVRLNFYTTDVDALLAHYDAISSRLAAVGCQPSSTLLGVKRLAFPELLIEIEATAAE